MTLSHYFYDMQNILIVPILCVNKYLKTIGKHIQRKVEIKYASIADRYPKQYRRLFPIALSLKITKQN